MAGDAYETLSRFWEIQDARDYAKLPDLFADDAVLEDEIWGRYEGIEAIRGFMAKMVEEMPKAETHFELEELSAEETTAWARWVAVGPTGRAHGVGVYKVRDGKLIYYRDYYNPASLRG